MIENRPCDLIRSYLRKESEAPDASKSSSKLGFMSLHCAVCALIVPHNNSMSDLLQCSISHKASHSPHALCVGSFGHSVSLSFYLSVMSEYQANGFFRFVCKLPQTFFVIAITFVYRMFTEHWKRSLIAIVSRVYVKVIYNADPVDPTEHCFRLLVLFVILVLLSSIHLMFCV